MLPVPSSVLRDLGGNLAEKVCMSSGTLPSCATLRTGYRNLYRIIPTVCGTCPAYRCAHRCERRRNRAELGSGSAAVVLNDSYRSRPEMLKTPVRGAPTLRLPPASCAAREYSFQLRTSYPKPK